MSLLMITSNSICSGRQNPVPLSPNPVFFAVLAQFADRFLEPVFGLFPRGVFSPRHVHH